MVGTCQVQFVLLLQHRLEQLQPKAAAWGKVGIWGDTKKGAGVPGLSGE